MEGRKVRGAGLGATPFVLAIALASIWAIRVGAANNQAINAFIKTTFIAEAALIASIIFWYSRRVWRLWSSIIEGTNISLSPSFSRSPLMKGYVQKGLKRR
ncbi:MAG: hypothetical protein LBF86_07255 [Helicobacteraceae bacterium]|nr:hypothetical protein [Helicobacteraceae bacterium]